jgi:hypothetical protein
MIGEFKSAGAYDLQTGQHPALDGYQPIQHSNKARVREAARLVANVLQGNEEIGMIRQAMRPTSKVFQTYLMERYPNLYVQGVGLRETMAVTDYQALYADVIDRMYYGYYNAFPVLSWSLVRRHPLMDTRLVKRYLNDGLVTPFVKQDFANPSPMQNLYGPVPQGGATLATASTAAITYQPELYQSGASINWQAFLNDDLGIFNDVPKRLAIVANRGIEEFLIGFFFDTNGPNVNLYKAGYRNLITQAYGASVDNPPLNAQGLQDGLKVLAAMRDSSGQPIMQMNSKIYLVYGSAYYAAVKNLMNQTSVQVSVEGGTKDSSGFPEQFVQVNNWLPQSFTPIYNPYIDIVSSSATGAWVLVCDPAAQERPSVEVGTLKSFETPQLFEEVPNTQRVGGGLEPQMGNFYTLNRNMKIISVFGGNWIDGRATVGSNGSGT